MEYIVGFITIGFILYCINAIDEFYHFDKKAWEEEHGEKSYPLTVRVGFIVLFCLAIMLSIIVIAIGGWIMYGISFLAKDLGAVILSLF